MKTKTINGVLQNFLGTLASRNTDFDGYLLFGYLVNDLERLKVDLLSQPEAAPTDHLQVLVRVATEKFRVQCEKGGLNFSGIKAAELEISRDAMPSKVWEVNGRPSFPVHFVARLTPFHGETCEFKKDALIAQHDPNVELRSTRS
jgi:hypothetical protein